jgi:TRAP transporter 4TM/12TM fusion protein
MPASVAAPIMTALKAIVIALVVSYICNIHGHLALPLFTEQMLVAVLGCGLALTFLSYPLGSGVVGEEAVAEAQLTGRRNALQPSAIDWVLAALAVATCFYVAVRYPELIKELVARPWWGVALSSVIVALVFEASRRVAGWSLIVIVLVLCAHALFGYLLPDIFAARPVALSRLMVYLAIDTNALLGSTLQTAIVVVTPFIIMGSILTRAGGSDFFTDLATALMGRYRGGAAKIAVVGSAFFGMISGSAVANVASVGTITIPLMKRAGFPAHTAAGIEAVGSTGGQIAPPVMGAAAFLMAEYLRVPYSAVLIAAIIPAFLYYASLFMLVDLESAKLGILGTPRDQIPSIGKVLKEGWHFVIPFTILVLAMTTWNLEAEYAALIASLVLALLAMVVPYKGKRLTPASALAATVSAGGAVVDIVAISAIAGVLIGAMTITGVAFSLTQQLLALSGGSLLLLLILTAIASFILGLPLPTVGVYVILATLAAPALVEAGVSPMQAHLFVLFQGILGMVTPPVALAAFAAATIAQSDQWKTGWEATRLSWCAYFIPFLFAYSPLLIMRGSVHMILLALALALLGIFMGALAVVGYFKAPVPVALRFGYAVTSMLLLVPVGLFAGSLWVNGAGVALAVAAIAFEASRSRNRGAAANSSVI